MKRIEALQFIDARAYYPIGQAAELVMVCTKTLRKDAREHIIPHQISPKNGRMRFKGKDLIHYRDHIK